MKIWYQVLSSLDRRPGFRDSLGAYLKSVADPDTEFELHGSDTTLQGEEYRSIFYLDASVVIKNALIAERRGFDAFAIGNSLDAGFHEAKEVVNIPVVSYLQTALLCISMMGRNFAMVVPHHKFIPAWIGMVAGHGFKDRLVSIDSIDMRPADLEKTYSDGDYEKQRIERFLALAKKAVAAGAEVILPLPSSWYLRLAKNGITEVEGAPLFNGIPALVKMTELMVKYRQITGVFISRKLTYASPPRELVEQALARHDIHLPG